MVKQLIGLMATLTYLRSLAPELPDDAPLVTAAPASTSLKWEMRPLGSGGLNKKMCGIIVDTLPCYIRLWRPFSTGSNAPDVASGALLAVVDVMLLS
jgi:hypothetical protein